MKSGLVFLVGVLPHARRCLYSECLLTELSITLRGNVCEGLQYRGRIYRPAGLPSLTLCQSVNVKGAGDSGEERTNKAIRSEE